MARAVHVHPFPGHGEQRLPVPVPLPRLLAPDPHEGDGVVPQDRRLQVAVLLGSQVEEAEVHLGGVGQLVSSAEEDAAAAGGGGAGRGPPAAEGVPGQGGDDRVQQVEQAEEEGDGGVGQDRRHRLKKVVSSTYNSVS